MVNWMYTHEHGRYWPENTENTISYNFLDGVIKDAVSVVEPFFTNCKQKWVTYQQSNNRIDLFNSIYIKDAILTNFTVECYFCATLL